MLKKPRDTLTLFVLSLSQVMAQVVDKTNDGAKCTVNGVEQPCPDWLGPVGIGFGLFWLVFMIWAIVFWIYMLVHLLKSDMPDGEKLVWVVVMFFASIIGSIIYYFVVKRAKPKAAGT